MNTPTSPPTLPTENLTDTVAVILTKSMNAVSDGAVWLQGQIPDVIHQFILWHIAKSVVWMIFGIFILIMSLTISRKFKRLAIEKYDDKSHRYYNSGLFSGSLCFTIFGSCIAAIIFLPNLMNFLELVIAPKLYLLEYVAALYNHTGH